MTVRSTIRYVLRRLWLWPLELWLRPITLADNITMAPKLELVAGAIGAAFWGSILGLLVYTWDGDGRAIWVSSLCFSMAVAFALAGELSRSAAAIQSKAMRLLAAAIAVLLATAVAATIGGLLGAFIGAFFGALFASDADSDTALGIGAAIGMFVVSPIFALRGYRAALGVVRRSSVAFWFISTITAILWVGLAFSLRPSVFTNITAIVGVMMSLTLLAKHLLIPKNQPGGSGRVVNALLLFWVVGLPVVAIASILGAAKNYMAELALALSFSLVTGSLVAVFCDKQGIAGRRAARDQRIAGESQGLWLVLPWILFLPLVAAGYWLRLSYGDVGGRLDEFLILVALAPLMLSGLPAWPIAALIATLQFRGRSIASGSALETSLGRTIPFWWQSCAFPLPGLRDWLIRLGREHGACAALRAIEQVQFDTLQVSASRRAARRLATDSGTALQFCGAVAMSTNGATLCALATTGPIGGALAALSAKKRDQEYMPLQFDFGGPPIAKSMFGFISGLLSQRGDKYAPSIESVRGQQLRERLAYSKEQLTYSKGSAELLELSALLGAISNLIESDNIHDWSGVAPKKPLSNVDDFLAAGWRLVNLFYSALAGLSDEYQMVSAASARRRLLESYSQRMRTFGTADFPMYWAEIGREISEHWITVLEGEARDARERLDLSVDFLPGIYTLGDQRLCVRVANGSAEPARSLKVILGPSEGVQWTCGEAGLRLLESGKTAELSFLFRADAQGPIRVAGRLIAEDLDGNPFATAFSFRIVIDAGGHPYQPPPYQPYVTGEGLGSDRIFVGRADLMDWLRGLWRQPDGKPAVVLVGQRRIGKSSLLNKVARDGLAGTGLLPITINIQGVGSEFDFLNEAMRRMAGALGASVSPPALDRAEPYAAFKAFLADVRPELAGRRFLLMLDEADLMPERGLGDLLPGFLRALMQEPQYPVVVLFCGTTRLRAMARDYFSILFNTAQFRTVSYLTAAESAEVLTKPAAGVLEYDPAVLTGAYKLTRGQPLLLQLIGATLINAFGEQVRRGEPRSNYVGTLDFDRAVKQVVRLETNAAFENHWEDSDPATHRVLAAVAWATDDLNRRQLDIDGIQAAMTETRLPLARTETFSILERLADDEVMERDGPTYRFWVPMYRRWVAWRWPTQRVRDEMGD